jgi:hypothetical protein
MASSVVTSVILILLASAASAATEADIEAARVPGLAWLIRHQNADGSWNTASGASITLTALSVEGLRNGGLSAYPSAAAIAWLGNADATSVDALARAIVALHPAGVGVTAGAEMLLGWRNRDGAWGAYEAFDTSFPDTPLALAAIRVTGLPFSDAEFTPALCAIVTGQRTEDPSVAGGWTYVLPRAASGAPSAAVLPTTANLLELEAIRASRAASVVCGGTAHDLATVIDQGVSWLLNQRRNADGGFGESGASTVLDTVLAYEVLRRLRPSDAATSAALDFLLAAQRASDGSWNGDVLQTALVLRALPAPATPLGDGDGDGMPDGVELALGTDPAVADSRWLAKASPVAGTLTSLVVRRAGTGSGTVTSADGGIACGALCAQAYLPTAVVTLSAQEAPGSRFAGWSGDADCGTGEIAMNTNKLCVAIFNAVSGPTATLTVTKAGTAAGTVTSLPAGIDCGTDCMESYPTGAVVTLKTTPAAGAIARWSGDPDCADGVVTMDGAKSCTATFDPQRRGILFGLGPGALSGGWLELMQPQPPYLNLAWLAAGWPAYNTTVGETRPAVCDVDGDGVKEVVVGFGPGGGGGWVQVLKETAAGWSHWQWLWISFNATQGETFPACGDLDGDGRDDIVVGLGAGSEGWLKIFTYKNGAFGAMSGTPAENGWIQVTWSGYNAATHPAVGDVNGDGRPEIVVGLGPGASGWLQIFGDQAAGFAPIPGTPSANGWLQAWSGANGETRPALCDVNGDGKREIVVGFGAGSAGWVQVFGHSPEGFAPFASAVTEGSVGWLRVKWIGTSNGETFPACGDLDGDGRDELVFGLGVGGDGWAELFDDAASQFAPLSWESSVNGWVQLHRAQYNTTPGYGLLRPAVLR